MLGLANCPCLSTTIREAQRPAPHRVLPTAGLVDAQSVCRMHAVRERTSQRDRELGRREAQNLQGGRFGQHFDFPNNSQRHQESITAPAAAQRQDPHMLRAGLRADPHAASPHHRFGCVSSSLARAGESLKSRARARCCRHHSHFAPRIFSHAHNKLTQHEHLQRERGSERGSGLCKRDKRLRMRILNPNLVKPSARRAQKEREYQLRACPQLRGRKRPRLWLLRLQQPLLSRAFQCAQMLVLLVPFRLPVLPARAQFGPTWRTKRWS